MPPTRLYELLHRYHSGNASEQETDELMQLIHQSQDDEELARDLKIIWEGLTMEDPIFAKSDFERMLGNIIPSHKEQSSKIIHFQWLRYVAAAVIILIGFGTYRYFNQNLAETKPVASKLPAVITPGGNRARLTLADGSTIFLDSSSEGLIAQQGLTKISKIADGKLAYDSKTSKQSTDIQQTNTISTPNGGQYQVVLPDGSTVWLNAASSIQFPTQFAANERRVVITGEVYFDVKKDATKPFRVQFGKSEVEVLGTSFNIMAYANEATTQTTLIEGAVKLKNGHENKKLTPGQQGTIQQNGAVEIQTVDTEEVIAWKEGLFYFKDADMTTVMKQVARWYDIEVQFENKSAGKIKKQFTGKVARNVKIEELLDMLHYAGVDYRIAGRKVTIIN